MSEPADSPTLSVIVDPDFTLPPAQFDAETATLHVGNRASVFVHAVAEDDLAGLDVMLRDSDGLELARAALTRVEDGSFTARLEFVASLTPGRHHYQVEIEGAEEEGDPLAVAGVDIDLAAHLITVSPWGASSALPAGDRFSFQIGFKCACGCDLTGLHYRVSDADGAILASGMLDGSIQAGSDGLFVASATGLLPSAPGIYSVKVTCGNFAGGDAPHIARPAELSLRVVGVADCKVSIIAIDERTRMPIRNAHILLHPYRAATDDHGQTVLNVTRGRYLLTVSGKKYIAYREPLFVEGDIAVEVRLSEPLEYDGYPMPEPGSSIEMPQSP